MADDKIIDFEAIKAKGLAKDNSAKDEQSVISVGLQKSMKINAYKDGETIELDPTKVDPQTTINVKNPEIDILIDKFCEEKSDQNLTALIRKIETARVLIPGQLYGEKKVPIPLTINTSEGDVLQPVFTDKSKIDVAPKSQIVMNVPFAVVVAQVIDKGPDIAGIAVNPFGKSVIFKRELVEKIMEVIKKKAMSIKKAQEQPIIPGVENGKVVMREDGTTATKIALNDEQYNVLERAKFEREFLPSKLFKKGEVFMEELSEGRGEYIDHLFEESYIEKRAYPYLTDEFTVMFMGLSENLDVATLTMPKRVTGPGLSDTIYLAWNKETGEGNYILFANAKDMKSREVFKIGKDLKPVSLGEAPEEGTEINWIIGKINGDSEA